MATTRAESPSPAEPPTYTLIIIGAGPAALSLSYFLRQRGTHHLILEQGHTAGHAWTKMPEDMDLLSPAFLNTLPGSTTSELDPEGKKTVSREQYCLYLQNYAKKLSAEISFATEVTSVVQVPTGFRLETSKGPMECEVLVNTTGYYSNPHTPSFRGMNETRIPIIHYADFKSINRFQQRYPDAKKVLIVGKKISGGQLLSDFAKVDVYPTLSHRSPIEFMPSSRIGGKIYLLSRDVIHYACRLVRKKYVKSFLPMFGKENRDNILSGRVRLLPNVTEFLRSEIMFTCGHREAFDAVILATGFRPACAHLKDLIANPEVTHHDLDGFEHRGVPNLFFLGIDCQVDYKSRTIEGFRRDARALARRIRRKLV